MGRGDLSIRKAAGGGAGLTYWRESQGTISGVLKDSWIPRAEGSNTVNDPWIPVANVAPSIYTSAVSYFAGPFVAGRYRVNYVEGALQYAGGLWGLNAGAPYGFRVVHSGGAAVMEGPYTTYTQQASQADVETANAGAYVEFDHAGGTIGVYLQDTPYSDNAPGSPNPTFELVGLPTTIDTPVHGIISSRGEGGMVISDGISTLPTPVLGTMTQRWAGGYDFQGGNAAFAGRVSGANPEADQDFVTKAWLNTRYFAFGAWTPSYGTYSGRDFSKWIPSSVVGADADAVIQPKGAGALVVQAPDGGGGGGNARGYYAVDLQLTRANAIQVASGDNAAVLGGKNNLASAAAAGTVAGDGNEATGPKSVVVGGFSSRAAGENACILGGQDNEIYDSATNAVILGGNFNAVGTGGVESVVLGGNHSAASFQQSIAWGQNAASVHSGALVFSSLNSGGATSSAVDECTLNFVGGYRFLGGGAAFDGPVSGAAPVNPQDFVNLSYLHIPVTEAAYTGVKDGVNTVFTMPNTFRSGSVRVFVNGLRLSAAAGHFTTTAPNVVALSSAPGASDDLVFDYFI